MDRVNHRSLHPHLWVFTLGCMLLLSLQPRSATGFLPTAQTRGLQPPLEKVKAKAVVPFSMIPSNHMLVNATINGKGPYRLIFDLGAPVTLIGNQVAETSGVVQANTPRSFLFSMRGEAEISQLQVGTLTVTKLPVIVFDHPALKALGNALGHSIDGIIGFTFFTRYRTTIDYQSNQMAFEPVEFEIRDLLRELPNRLMSPKPARRRVLAPKALWGLQLARSKPGQQIPGVLISHVLPGSPAALAGLKAGDVLTTLGNRWTTSVTDTYAAAQTTEPNKNAQVSIVRDGKEQTLRVQPVDGT